MEIIAIIWILCGWYGHINNCIKEKTMFGVPWYKEFSVYLMLIPAAIVGPLIFIGLWIENRKGEEK